MINEKEKEVQASRIKDMVNVMDQKVWNNPAFPYSHRPDVENLSSKIFCVETIPFIPARPHPHMKSEWLRENEILERRERAMHSSKIALYDSRTQNIYINSELLNQHDSLVKRVLAHELATDTLERESYILPDEYTLEYRQHIKSVLANKFDKKRRPNLNDTHVVKSGFRQILQASGCDIVDFFDQEHDLSEVYPTMFEIITDQVLKNGFDQTNALIAQGAAKIPHNYDHPNFAATFFSVARNVPWQDLLDAFKAEEPNQIFARIEQKGNSPEISSLYINNLVSAMSLDENPMQLFQ